MTIDWKYAEVRLGILKPWGGNPKTLTKKEARALLESFNSLGKFQTIAIGPDGEVYDGHQRLDVLMSAYGENYIVPAMQSPTALSDEQRREVVLRSRQYGRLDWDVLSGWSADELISVGGFDNDMLKGMKLDIAAISHLLDSEKPPASDAEPQVDRAAELNEKWQVKTGDLFAIGEHRLLCGDSTKREDVERVMGGEKARLVFTSPPYDAQREYEIGKFDWLALMNGVSDNIFQITGNPADVIINLGMSYKDGRVNFYWDSWFRHCEELGHPLYGWYVWDKGSGFPGEWNGRLAPSHEFIFHFSVGRVSAKKWIKTSGESEKRGTSGKRFRQKDGSLQELTSPNTIGQPYKVPDSVIRVGREMARGIHTEFHPAVFSEELPSFGIRTWSDENYVVYEPFAGSGTTLVACENLSRKCRAIEISPNYCAVILERMANAFPGIKIEKIA